MSGDLVLLDGAERALAEATSVADLKAFRDEVTAAKAWAKSRGLGVEAENKAAEYILRAERRIGQELIRMAETGERAMRGPGARPVPQDGELGPVRLGDLGLTYKDSEAFTAVARLPEDVFEAMLTAARESRERIAKINFYRKPRNPENENPRTAEDTDFMDFRAVVYRMLGWKIGADGEGGPTKNGLTQLPNDELAQVAVLLQAMIAAYQQAKQSRVG